MSAMCLGFLFTGCRGFDMPDYNHQSAVHQDVYSAYELELGQKMDAVRQKFGKPVRVDKEGDTVVWQYCNTQRIRSHFVALSFSSQSSALIKKNKYTIFWDETKDKVLSYGDVVVRPSTYQMSCDYLAQKMGVKDPKNIELWFTAADAATYRQQQRYNQTQQSGYYDQSQQARQQEEQRMRQREQYNRVNNLR